MTSLDAYADSEKALHDLDDVAAEFGIDLDADDTHDFLTFISGHGCTCGLDFRSQVEWARHADEATAARRRGDGTRHRCAWGISEPFRGLRVGADVWAVTLVCTECAARGGIKLVRL